MLNSVRRLIRRIASQLIWLLMLPLAPAEPEATPRCELIGFSLLPADTFTSGPESGQFDANGMRMARARFAAQPVQGFSDLARVPGARGGARVFYVLSDNGFGTKANSADFLLRMQPFKEEQLAPAGRASTIGAGDLEPGINLADPGRVIRFPIINENTPDRKLTGADLDPESLAVLEDGTLWIGDEFGPWLLHFDGGGALLEIVGVPGVRSPQNPTLAALGTQPDQVSSATLPSSGGFEGLARTPDGRRLWGLLEKGVRGDPPGLLRLYEFSLERTTFTRQLFYELESAKNAIGELETIDAQRLLVIERDNLQGEAAQCKRIYEMDVRHADARGVARKRLVADLLQIDDPQNLAGHGPHFRFPFITIESVCLLDERTLLLCNDNNYDATGGRGAQVKDNTEFIRLRIAPLK